MSSQYILSIDQGTTRTKSLIMNAEGRILGISRYDIPRIYPRPGWVEQDPEAIWESVVVSVKDVISNTNIPLNSIAGIGIADQGETIVLWDKYTGRPVYNAIVWQCRRTASMIEQLRKDYPDIDKIVRRKTGLILDPYFSSTKIRWILNNIEEAKNKLREGRLLAGTTDTWVIWKLSGGRYHITDYATASRTMLLNINTLKWDKELLEIFGIPEDILPELVPNSGVAAYTDVQILGREIPVSGIIVDQQAALFGHMCLERGMMKATYGTGVFVLANIGSEPVLSEHGLLTTIAWVIDKGATYAFDGGEYYAGALIQWLVESLGIIKNVAESGEIAKSVPGTEGVYFVPAFVGLAAPYWAPSARAAVLNINPSTNYRHIVRAALEGIAYRVYDIVEAMYKSLGVYPRELRVDGGMVENEFLMQFQADILGIPVTVPAVTELTGFGVGLLAGLGIGLWNGIDTIKQFYKTKRTYQPHIDKKTRDMLIDGWREAIRKVLSTK